MKQEIKSIESELEQLIIYKQYVILVDYTMLILLKFPKSERYSMCSEIKKETYRGLRRIIYAQKCSDIKERASLLHELDASLKVLKVLVRISKKRKYISTKNYVAWSKKLTNISNLTWGWIKACRRR